MGTDEAPAKRILIVDDEDDILQIMFKRLTATGYEVSQATSGHEALLKVKSFFPDLIIMDIMLPDMDGSDVVKILSRDMITQAIPVIFLSGIVTREDHEPEPEIVVDGRHYRAIPKPVTFQELLRQVEKVFR